MNPTIIRVDNVIVVDASLEDYATLFADEYLRDLMVRFFATGEEALRSTDAATTALWMVNLQLPDMTGVNFLGLVRARARRCPVFLVSDVYSSDEEVAARAAGASAYLCKPVNAAWLTMCRHTVSRAAIRKGMPRTVG